MYEPSSYLDAVVPDAQDFTTVMEQPVAHFDSELFDEVKNTNMDEEKDISHTDDTPELEDAIALSQTNSILSAPGKTQARGDKLDKVQTSKKRKSKDNPPNKKKASQTRRERIFHEKCTVKESPAKKRRIKYTHPKKKTSKDRLLSWIDTYSKNYGIWVQCTKCLKWRLVKEYEEAHQVPNIWHCSLNKDKSMDSCDIPENIDGYEFSKTEFIPGSIVWAKLASYPWWPAMIEDDPDLEEYYEVDEKTNRIAYYHVTFLDEKVTRAWVPSNHIRPFLKKEKLPKLAGKNEAFVPLLEKAQDRAMKAMGMALPERLKQFSFAFCYNGKWPKINEVTDSINEFESNLNETQKLLDQVDDLDSVLSSHSEASGRRCDIPLSYPEDGSNDELEKFFKEMKNEHHIPFDSTLLPQSSEVGMNRKCKKKKLSKSFSAQNMLHGNFHEDNSIIKQSKKELEKVLGRNKIKVSKKPVVGKLKGKNAGKRKADKKELSTLSSKNSVEANKSNIHENGNPKSKPQENIEVEKPQEIVFTQQNSIEIPKSMTEENIEPEKSQGITFTQQSTSGNSIEIPKSKPCKTIELEKPQRIAFTQQGTLKNNIEMPKSKLPENIEPENTQGVVFNQQSTLSENTEFPKPSFPEGSSSESKHLINNKEIQSKPTVSDIKSSSEMSTAELPVGKCAMSKLLNSDKENLAPENSATETPPTEKKVTICQNLHSPSKPHSYKDGINGVKDVDVKQKFTSKAKHKKGFQPPILSSSSIRNMSCEPLAVKASNTCADGNKVLQPADCKSQPKYDIFEESSLNEHDGSDDSNPFDY